MIEQLRRHRLYILMASLNIAVLLGVIYLLRRPEPRVVTITTPATLTTSPETKIEVQVSGAILQPGVYTLTLGSRVTDALDAAGGARPDADLDGLNLALKLNDGDAVEVPTRAAQTESRVLMSPPSNGSSRSATALLKVNINTATIEQLDTLPRIGPVLAQRIVDYRTHQGLFRKIEDIKNVSGIGDTLFQGLKDLISVE